LLRFPEAPTPAAAYGDAIHKTLQWVHESLRVTNKLPTSKSIINYFLDMLERKHLQHADFTRLGGRGQVALTQYFRERGSMLDVNDIVERGFNNEGVVVAGAQLSGKIDKLHYEADNTVRVIDFKTGKPAVSWQGKDDYEKLKLHKYRQQLLFYKLLIEHSASYSGKRRVSSGALEFVEPNEHGELIKDLTLTFDETELERFIQLIGAVWQHITSLNFPDVSQYRTDLRGVLAFEQDLIDGKI
jgi:DNA helicase-2/ATP-dependent DNA helicase PcrA